MKSFVLAVSLMLSNVASGALPGVTDFRTNPGEITARDDGRCLQIDLDVDIVSTS